MVLQGRAILILVEIAGRFKTLPTIGAIAVAKPLTNSLRHAAGEQT
jgi:hypothetical protein